MRKDLLDVMYSTRSSDDIDVISSDLDVMKFSVDVKLFSVDVSYIKLICECDFSSVGI